MGGLRQRRQAESPSTYESYSNAMAGFVLFTWPSRAEVKLRA
jgi:esterase/lipase superfamily enzyme